MPDLTYWHWFMLGLILLGIELFAPGSFFIWIGCAALITSIFTYLFGLLFIGQFLTFAIFCVISVLFGVRIYRNMKLSTDAFVLNRKTDQMTGQEFGLSDPIINGVGHITIGDSRWRVIGEDLPAGTKVKVIDLQGNSLIVKQITETEK